MTCLVPDVRVLNVVGHPHFRTPVHLFHSIVLFDLNFDLRFNTPAIMFRQAQIFYLDTIANERNIAYHIVKANKTLLLNPYS